MIDSPHRLCVRTPIETPPWLVAQWRCLWLPRLGQGCQDGWGGSVYTSCGSTQHRVFCPPVVDFSKARLPPLGRTLGQLSPPVTGGEAEPRSPVTQGPVLICGSLGPEPRKPLSQLPPIIGPVSPTFGRGAVLGLPRPQLQLWASS